MQNYINKMFPQAALSTRTDAVVTKPPVFHSASKRKEQQQHTRTPKPGKFLKGKRKNVIMLIYVLLHLFVIVQSYSK